MLALFKRTLFWVVLVTAYLYMSPLSYAGGGGKMQQEQKIYVQEKAPKKDGGLSPEVLAALITGGLGLVGVILVVRNKRKD